MNQLLSIGILPVVLTLFAYQIGLQCQKKWKTPLFNPILIGMLLVILFLSLTGMERKIYQEGTKYLSWLMTPATISLAIPMYEQFQALRKNLKAIAIGVAAGTVSCLGMVLALALIFGYHQSLTISLLPKGITTAIGMTLAELYGGTSSIATLAIVITGILGNMFGTYFCKWFGITQPIAQGVAYGTSSHVIGTAKANEISTLTGAVSSLSLVVSGLLTALAFPLLTSLL